MTTPLPGLLWASRPCHRLRPAPVLLRTTSRGCGAVPGVQPLPNRSPASNASFPMVPSVPTVQSMGPCLMSRESSPQHRRQPVPPVANASRPASRRPYPGRGVGVSPTPARRLIYQPQPSPPTVPGPFPVSSRRLYRGRGVSVSPTPTRRLIYPPQPSTPSVVWSSPCVCVGRLHAGALEGRRQRSPGRSPGKGPPHEHALEGHLNKFASKS